MKLDIRITLLAILITAAATFYFTNKQNSSTVTAETEKQQNNVVTTTHETTKVDGSKEVVTVVVDKTKISTDKKSVTIIAKVPQYLISANVYGLGIQTYALSVQKRVLPSVLAGVSVNSKRELGLVLSMEF